MEVWAGMAGCVWECVCADVFTQVSQKRRFHPKFKVREKKGSVHRGSPGNPAQLIMRSVCAFVC